MLRCGKDYRVALADFAETHDARRRGGAFPESLLKTNFDLEGFKLTNFEFREPLLKQLLTTFTVTLVVSSGVLNMMMSLVTILLTLWCQPTELD